MNRRDFMRWLGRLLAALPFVALADLEPEPELTQWWGVDQAIGDSAAATIRWMPDGETIHSISLKDVLVFNGIYSHDEIQGIWEKLRELNGVEQGFYYRYILKPDSEWVEYNL